MSNFDTKRADAIRKKNEAYTKAERFEKQSEEFAERRREVLDSKSLIPDELPEEIKAQIDAVYDQKEKELDEQADELADEMKEALDDANEAMDEMHSLGKELEKKSSDLAGLKDVPLVGAFLENKSKELGDQSEQLFDLAKETQQYSDKLAESRNRVMKK